MNTIIEFLINKPEQLITHLSFGYHMQFVRFCMPLFTIYITEVYKALSNIKNGAFYENS